MESLHAGQSLQEAQITSLIEAAESTEVNQFGQMSYIYNDLSTANRLATSLSYFFGDRIVVPTQQLSGKFAVTLLSAPEHDRVVRLVQSIYRERQPAVAEELPPSAMEIEAEDQEAHADALSLELHQVASAPGSDLQPARKRARFRGSSWQESLPGFREERPKSPPPTPFVERPPVFGDPVKRAFIPSGPPVERMEIEGADGPEARESPSVFWGVKPYAAQVLSPSARGGSRDSDSTLTVRSVSSASTRGYGSPFEPGRFDSQPPRLKKRSFKEADFV